MTPEESTPEESTPEESTPEESTPDSETPAERLSDQADRDELRDRYYGLLQELRVVLPGVQVLVAFMLTVPFAQRFAQLDGLGEALFGFALVAAILSVVSFVTPTALHRFGRRTARGRRLQWSIVMTQVGMLLLGVSMELTLAVVARFLFEPIVTGLVVGVTSLATIGFWLVLPALLHRGERSA